MTKAITNLTFNYSSELLSELTSKRWRSNSITVTTRRLEFKHSAPTNTRTGNFHQWDQTNSLQVFGSHVNFFNLELHNSPPNWFKQNVQCSHPQQKTNSTMATEDLIAASSFLPVVLSTFLFCNVVMTAKRKQRVHQPEQTWATEQLKSYTKCHTVRADILVHRFIHQGHEATPMGDLCLSLITPWCNRNKLLCKSVQFTRVLATWSRVIS